MMMEATIEEVWFDKSRIFIETSKGEILSRPLEAFPRLLEASDEERASFTFGKFRDDIRWPLIDEDVHISSFYDHTEPNTSNEIGQLFKRFPQLNVSQVARSIGIDKTLLSNYIYGFKKPSKQRIALIKNSLRSLGKQLEEIQ